ncbi:Phospholipid scramblase 2-like protein [Leptotrombidium deliense]|uniref:Phospholipid scramblase n=1 Tax=Leptotrombidium deliense TaxID=299467 RepID=A0A443SPY2_9ACAR|nr:Phospholipid scramblase 2-like protein [Leptotrombidium deliense]
MNAVAISDNAVTEQPDDSFFDDYRNFKIEGMMPRPNVNLSCPHGLEYLSEVNEIIILQESDLLSAEKYNGASSFILINKSNQQMYTAKEGCCWSCCKCCFQNVEVMAPIGRVIGYVHEEKSCLQERFTIKNASEDIMFRMMGPRKSCCFDYEKELNILTRNGQIQVGTITKEWISPSLTTCIKNYKISLNFSVDLDVTSKALLLAATFLMDIMYYEEKKFAMKSYLA